METGSRGRAMNEKVAAGGPDGQGSSWQSGHSHIPVWINREEQLGSETDHTTQGSSAGK